MYERMLDKNTIPDEVTVREHLGEDSHNRLADMGCNSCLTIVDAI